MVPNGHQAAGALAVPCDLPRPSGYQLHAGRHHGHAGVAAPRQRAVPHDGRSMPQPGAGGAAMSKADPFPTLPPAFFYAWLFEPRNASIHTARSYRDTWRLSLRLVAQRAATRVVVITLANLTASTDIALLGHAGPARCLTI